MSGHPFVVVVTGSECTGKTTMALEIAGQFDAPWSPEFVRAYLERKGAELDGADVEPIARGQIQAENAAAAVARELVVRDTDLVSTAVYARHYYGACPTWIADAARERRGDLYLLLHPDVPWVADGLQRDRPAGRDQLHGLFRAALAGIGARVIDISGTWDQRRERAFAVIDAAIRAGGGPVSR